MNIKPGDICYIEFISKGGCKSTKALLIEVKDSKSLWLLIYTRKPGIILNFGEKSLLSFRGKSIKEFGYTPICKGNLIYTDTSVITKYLGTISIRQLSDVCCDIFASSEAWKLTWFRSQQSSGIKFWINLNPATRDHYSEHQKDRLEH